MSWTLRDDDRWGIDVTSVLQFSLTGAPHAPVPTPTARSVDVAATSSRAGALDAYAGSVVATVVSVGQVQVPVSGIEPPRLFVSNAGQPQSAWSRSVMGQGFTTGSAARGYGLGSIELYLESPPADGLTMPLVTLHADEAGSPGELLARFRNPDSFTAGANRFGAPFAVVLDANRTYHVVANLGADAPQAFSLVTSGEADVPTGDPEWRVQTGSWLLSSNWLWQPNENHGLRFALYEPGENDPALWSNTPEDIAATPASEPSGAPEEFVAAPPPPPPPPPSSTSGETVATTPWRRSRSCPRPATTTRRSSTWMRTAWSWPMRIPVDPTSRRTWPWVQTRSR